MNGVRVVCGAGSCGLSVYRVYSLKVLHPLRDPKELLRSTQRIALPVRLEPQRTADRKSDEVKSSSGNNSFVASSVGNILFTFGGARPPS